MSSAATSTDSDLIREAYAHTSAVARHYENFTVVSLLLPRALKQHFYNIYAFCREADDLADEISDKDESLRELASLREDVHRMYSGRPERKMMLAVQQTVRAFNIPPQPFLDLIDAFEQDRRIFRYETFDQVLDYSRRSANPVGRLVLYMCGYSDEERQELSDFTCTGLQLANFWQDVSEDIDRGRIYIPLEDMRRFGVTEEQIIAGTFTPAFGELMRFEVDRADEMLRKGEALLPMVHRRVRADIALYGRGGRAILQAIRDINYNTLARRPSIGKRKKLALLIRYLTGM